MFLDQSKTGLYISDNGIHVVQIKKQRSAIQVLRSILIPFSQASANLLFSLPTPEEIKQAFIKAGIEDKKVSISLRGDATFIRHFEMPLIFSKKELPETIRFEAKKHLPFPMAELQYTFETRPDKTRHKLQVVFFAAKKDLVAPLSKLFYDAGFIVESLEPSTVSLERVLSFSQKKAKMGTFMIIQQDTGALNTVVFKNGLPVIARYSVIESTADAREEDMKAHLAEARLSFDYFSKSFKGQKIEKIVLCGVSQEARWREGLTQEFNLPIEALRPVSFIATKETISPSMICAIGAALGGPSLFRKAPSNLLSEQAAPIFSITSAASHEEEKKLLIRWAGAESAVFLVLMVGLYFMLSGPVVALGREISSLQAASRATGIALTGNLDDIQLAEQKLLKQSAQFKSLMDERIFWTEKINEIIQHLPQGIWLTKLRYEDRDNPAGGFDRSLEIEGDCIFQEKGKALEEINRFISAMQSDKEFMRGFAGIKMHSFHQKNVGASQATHFSISCKTGPERSDS